MNKKKILYIIILAIILIFVGLMTIKYVLVKNPIETVEIILSQKDDGDFSALNKYFSDDFKSLVKESSDHKKTAVHKLSQNGNEGEVTVTLSMDSANDQGTTKVDVAEFKLRKSSSFPGYWQVQSSLEINPQFSQTLRDVLPQKEEVTGQSGDEIDLQTGVKIKLDNFKVDQNLFKTEGINKYSFDFLALGPALPDLNKTSIFFALRHDQNLCSSFQSNQIEVPSQKKNISLLSSETFCEPNNILVFRKLGPNYSIKLNEN